jgi:hypothetical protein
MLKYTFKTLANVGIICSNIFMPISPNIYA